MDHGAKPSFSAVCSPPLALLYKNRKKGKPSFTLDVDLDEELCDALCKISKSSEELWKEISPPSPIGSKANTSADWMSLDAAVQHAANQNSHIPRIEVDGPPDDSSSPFEATSRYNPANYNNHLSRVSGRGSSSNLLSTGILPLKAASTTPSSLSHHPPPSILHSSSEQPLSLPAPSSSPMSSTSTQLPVFSSAFANYANPSFNHHNNMDAFHNHGPSVTTNSISISGNSNMNNQNSSSSHSSNSSPHISSHQTSPPIQPLSPLPQSPTKKEPRKTSAQFSAPYTSPQLKIHQYVPPGSGAEESPFSGTHKNNITTNNNNNNNHNNNHNNHNNHTNNSNNSNNNSNNSNSNNVDKNHDKMRNHENEKLWSEVVLNCNKLKAHASRGVAQTLSWNEINDAMNSTRSVMGSLLSLLQLHSNAYANIYNSVPGYHAPSENGSNPFGDVPNQFMRFASPQFDPFGHHAHQFNNMSMSMPMPMSMSMNMNTPSPVEVKKENNSPNVDNFHAPYNTTPPLAPFGYEDNHRANKMPRRESVNHGTPETLSRSESTPNMSGNMPLSPLQNVMSLPNLNLSPVITALSNLQSSSLSNSTDSITGNGSSSDEAPSHTPTRSYPTPTPTPSTTATTPPEPAPTGGKSGNWNKKNRGKKRSKYADLDLMCLSCGVKQTPEWRRGPAGAKTLCNACGLHWAKVLKAEGKSGVATDSKKAFLLEQKKNQFMLLAKKDGSRHKD